MAYRTFAAPASSGPALTGPASTGPALTGIASRRDLLRGGAALSAAALLGGLPLGRMAMAHAGHWPTVQALAKRYVDQRKVANMVAVMGRGQDAADVIAHGTLALGGSTPADIQSLYRIYSMTKPVTGMATMLLVDEGALGLDQPLHEILPAFRDMRVQATPDGNLEDTVPAARPITIRHLLTHTAGLGYGIIQQGPIRAAYEEAGISPGKISRLPLPGLGRARPAESLEAFADNLAQLPLVYQPGTQWSYSVSLDLLGRVIEVASGMPFDTFLSQRIFEPAGMTSTYFRVPQAQVARLTTNYAVLNDTLLPIDPARGSIFLDEPEFPFGGAGLVSSPADYDRFLRMLLGLGEIDGTRVMSEAAVRLGTSNLLPAEVSTQGIAFGLGEGFGAGGVVGLGENEGSFGWGGAAGTVGLVQMKWGLRGSLYTQYVPSTAYGVQNEFRQAVVTDAQAMLSEMAA